MLIYATWLFSARLMQAFTKPCVSYLMGLAEESAPMGVMTLMAIDFDLKHMRKQE